LRICHLSFLVFGRLQGRAGVVFGRDARDGKYGKHGKHGMDGEGRFSSPGPLRVQAGVAVLPFFGNWLVAYLTIRL